MTLLEDRTSRGFATVDIGEPLEQRMEFLDPLDRKILELAVRGRLTRREIGALMGHPAGTITRRLQRILARLNHPVSIALVHRGDTLRPHYREVGLDYFLRGHPLRQISRTRHLTIHEARLILAYLRGWAER